MSRCAAGRGFCTIVPMQILTGADLEFWREHGYVVVGQAVPSENLQAVIDAIWQFRRRGGRLYQLAIAHDLSPTEFSKMLNGACRVYQDDPRILAIGQLLGLEPGQCFMHSEEGVAS